MKEYKNYILNRKMYTKIRKMDHTQMSNWAENLYNAGYREGLKTAPTLDLEKVKESLLGIKGLGATKVDAIVEVVREHSSRVKGD